MELDISKIIHIPSDTEIPVHNNTVPTKRPLCTNTPENSTILTNIEAVLVIKDISEDIKESESKCITNIPKYIDELLMVLPKEVTEVCNSDIFENKYYTLITNVKDLLKYLSELLIRFDTNPLNYTKAEYQYLLSVLYKTLLYIYKNHPFNFITKEWLDPHSDEKLPTEKLVKETIDLEVENRLNEISRVEELISDEVSARQSDISRIEEEIGNETQDRIESDSALLSNINLEALIRLLLDERLEGIINTETEARELADIDLYNTKLNNLTAGDNISIVNDIISAVDTIYDDTEVKSDISDLLQNKQDILTAGENISITNNVISAVDTIYDDTEVRGLIDQVDSKVDALDDFECGTIVPTTTNFVEGTEYTVHEALQRTANLFEGYQGEIDDINDLIPNQATTSNKLADKAFVNSTVATNAANFRGNWSTWTSVPINVTDYPEDYTGSKTPTNNDYLVIQDASGYSASCDGLWRFIYIGEWATDGKSGWNPAYRIGHAFTQAQQDAIDSGITSGKVSTYDGYASSIGALQTDKIDKIYTASKVYGTDSQGSLIGYTAGEGISFTNGQIVNTRTSAVWGNITGTLSDLTDLNTTLSNKEDKSNKVTSISNSSTDIQYPSAKCVYDAIDSSKNSLLPLILAAL